jgi:hypothetical protein
MAILGFILLAFPVVTLQALGVVVVIAAGVATQFDTIQAIVIGCLCAMLGQTYSASATNAGAWGVALFVVVQLMVYVPLMFVYLLFVPAVGLWYADSIIVLLVVFLLLVLLHEIAIQILWALLRVRLR